MKTIIFDFDGTLTKKSNEIWRRIWKRLNATDIDDMLFKKYMNKEIDNFQWTKEIEKEFILRKVDKSLLNSLIDGIKMMDSLEDTLIELKKIYNCSYDDFFFGLEKI